MKKKKEERITYSKKFKKEVMILLSRDEDPYEIFKSAGYDIDLFLEKDKKYLSKLIHKWRKEMYENRELIFFSNQELSNDTILDELFKEDEKEDENLFEEYYKNKYKNALRETVKASKKALKLK